MIKVDRINKYYGENRILHNVSLDINEGDIVTISGRSGAGKSTLLYILSLVEKIDNGKMIFDDNDVTNYDYNRSRKLRKAHVSIILQSYGLINNMTVYQNIQIAQKIKGKNKYSIDTILEKLGISELKYKKPFNLSGGEKQRVAIARALLTNTKYIFMDEPTGNLDRDTSEMFVDLLLNLKEEFNLTYVIVTHDNYLASIGNKKYILKDGELTSKI